MTRPWSFAVVAAAACCCVLAAPASAKWYGSTLAGKPNADYGCETALTTAPLGGVQRSPTNQASCTYRHGGYLFSNRPTFLVPATGRITKIRIKSGPNPARARLTVLTGSSRVDPFTGRDQPGTYTCCTARYVGKSFKLKPNRVTTKKVNVRVYNLREKELQIRIHSSDGLGLSFGRGGTVPLKITQAVGGFTPGDPPADRVLAAHGQGRPPRRRVLDVRHRPDVPVELQAGPPLRTRTGGPEGPPFSEV